LLIRAEEERIVLGMRIGAADEVVEDVGINEAPYILLISRAIQPGSY
jgi:hypothetical protein